MSDTERVIRMVDKGDHKFIDFTVPGSPLLEGLVAPVRTIEYRIGNVLYRVPRGADNPTPDNVVKIGGFWNNLSDGRTSREMKDVI